MKHTMPPKLLLAISLSIAIELAADHNKNPEVAVCLENGQYVVQSVEDNKPGYATLISDSHITALASTLCKIEPISAFDFAMQQLADQDNWNELVSKYEAAVS